MTDPYDVSVIGGGIVGLATAYQVLQAHPDLRLVVLEKEARLATHQSGRNSGVVHAGLYYRPGSLKARLCREGKAELEEFARDRNIPYQRCGKLIVAVRPSEVPRLSTLRERALANGISDIRELGPAGIREIEPHVTGLRALHSPGTGVIDFRAVTEDLAATVRARGGEILTGVEVHQVTVGGAEQVLRTSRGDLRTRTIIACAGLHADRLLAPANGRSSARIIPFRGGYLALRPSARHLVRALVYPVPDPALPFLGIHLTKRIDGSVIVGPNAILALAREGYRLGAFSWRDSLEMAGFPGFWRLLVRHLRPGLREALHEVAPRTLLPELRRFVPELDGSDLGPGPAGVRAQLVERSGTIVDDFRLWEADGVIQVVNAPSPAATASLAIGRYVASRAGRRFGWE
jgi:(S)-2-hydroxyglutarate dehydrogenase